jgi:hypothetical protein
MRFAELPEEMRPNSEASGDTRSDAGNSISRELISAVIDRWRSASMSYRLTGDDDVPDYGESPLQPAQPSAPAMPATPPPSPRGEALRASLLKKPLDAAAVAPGAGAPPPLPPGYPQRPR